MKRKMRKFSEGDVVEDFAKDANDNIQSSANKGSPAKSESYTAEPDSFVGAKKQRSFKEEFNDARTKGKKVFTWNGKTYTTELAEDKPTARTGAKVDSASKAATQAKPAGKAPAEVSAVSKREESPSVPAAQSRKRELKLPEVKYTDEMNDALMNAYGGSGLAKIAGKEIVRAGELGAAAAMRAGSKALKDASEGAKKVINYTKDLEPTMFKRGGAVKSSASRRADGIAQRGKTKGKIC